MICAIVLAAGRSRRMGVQKLLLSFGKTTVILHIVDQLLDSVIDEIHLVVGYEASRIAEQISGRPVSIVTNPDYESGMLSSVRCGFQSLPQHCDAVLVALGDQPAITCELVNEMIQSFGAGHTAYKKVNKWRQPYCVKILVPLYRGKRGHPILVSTQYRNEIMTCYDDVGLKGLLSSHPEDIFELNVSTSGVLSDIDVPEDYQRELMRDR